MDRALMPGSKTPKPPGAQIHSWPGCHLRTSSCQRIWSARTVFPASAALAPATAGGVLRMPGGEQGPSRLASEPLDLLDLAQGRRRRLFEQHVEPGGEGGRGDGEADGRGGADRDGVELAGHGLQHRLGGSGKTGTPASARARGLTTAARTNLGSAAIEGTCWSLAIFP